VTVVTPATPAETQQPSLVGSDARRFWNLTWTLAVTDWKLRFYGSVLGYVWSLARPFLFFGVIYFVFTEIVPVNTSVPYYGVCILFSLLFFNFFAEGTGGCLGCLVMRESMLRKMRFPRLVIPFSAVLTALFNLGMTLVAAAIFAAISGVYPNYHWIELPFIVLAVVAYVMGIGLILGSLFPRYRDVQPIWDVVSQMLFYASPVLYVAAVVPDRYRDLYMLNPMAVLLTETRHALVDPNAPHPWELTSWLTIAGSGAIVVVVLVAGALIFRREAPKVAENL
jgi:ABC-2 type transport system permease protein